MAITIKDVSFEIRPRTVSGYGKAIVDVHFQEVSENGTANNIKINVFVDANSQTQISEIEKSGMQEVRLFLQRTLDSLAS
jgi:acetolactate synthase small subunit